MADDVFREERDVRRTRWNRVTKRGSSGKSPLFDERSNEGKPIVISHYVPHPFGTEKNHFFFAYLFPLTPKQAREGYATLLFVGPACETEGWLRRFSLDAPERQSFYETHAHRSVSLPSAFRAFVDPVQVPYSVGGQVCLERGTIVYRVGRESWPLMTFPK
ncbi:hypothetical protein EXS73_01895 [Candidatus Pacearchaeota archaeon]|nr:hypothetical protein [Candidatus Pacearchaeota archaeon]